VFPMDYSRYPRNMVEDIARLRRRIEASMIPAKVIERNLIIASWNIRSLGRIYDSYEENTGSPKRNLRGLAYIAEIIQHFDIVAIQEVKNDLTGVRKLQEWLGPDWGVIFTDVTLGALGNNERLTFLFDSRRVTPSGLAGEIVLPPTERGDPAKQFARSPYAVGFQTHGESLVLVTAHIYYGRSRDDRIGEISALAEHVAEEMHARALKGKFEEGSVIVLGDFNTDKRGDDPLFRAFTATGLTVPLPLRKLRTALGKEPKYYDQIAWFMDAFDLIPTGRCGVIDFSGAVYPELTLHQMSFRVSDHLPLWVEFNLDHSEEIMAETLGLDPGMPHPLDSVPDPHD
jgi:endonuclease/exonuclease/phosphatase family metal-dependent hydrolase